MLNVIKNSDFDIDFLSGFAVGAEPNFASSKLSISSPKLAPLSSQSTETKEPLNLRKPGKILEI